MTKIASTARLLTTAATLVIASVGWAAAEQPWMTTSYELGAEFAAVAYQADMLSGYQLIFECYAPSGEAMISILSLDPYDPATRYALDVPTQFVVDGKALPEMIFSYGPMNGQVALFAYFSDDPETFIDLYGEIAAAEREIEVSFSGINVGFPAEGVRAATQWAESQC